jgi:ELWxxDGT repeat protein
MTMLTRTRRTRLAFAAVLLAVASLPLVGGDVHAALVSDQIADVNPGSGSSAPDWYTRLGDLVLFTADDGAHGRELWSVDLNDLALGASMVKDINASGSANVDELVVVGSNVFFRANDGTHGTELWMTDGSEANTELVADINPGSVASGLVGLTALGDYVYFSACNSGDPQTSCDEELWRSNGTSTSLFADINPTRGSSPHGLTRVGSQLFFIADDGEGTIDVLHANSNWELWKTDGTTTELVKDINPPVQTPTEGSWFISNRPPKDLTSVDGFLYFGADDGSGYAPWRTDGTEAGTYVLVDENSYPESAESLSLAFAKFGNYVYFPAWSSSAGIELWRSDGTPASGSLFKDLFPAGSPSIPSNFAVVDRWLFFSARTTNTGSELWRSDGTEVGTVLVSDIVAGSTGSNPHALTAVGDTLVFLARHAAVNQYDVVVSTGTTSGTFRTAYTTAGFGSFRQLLPLSADTLVFDGNDGATGVEPWMLVLASDFDDDRILNGIDEEPVAASDRFSDRHRGGKTSGQLTDVPSGMTVTVADHSDPALGLSFVVADPTNPSTPRRVRVDVDGKHAYTRLQPGTYSITDPPPTTAVDVEIGLAEIVLGDGDAGLVVIESGGAAAVDENVDGTYTVTATAGTITVNGAALTSGSAAVVVEASQLVSTQLSVAAARKGGLAKATIDLNTQFLPRSNIALASEALGLDIGPYHGTVPPNGFVLRKGKYVYSSIVNHVALKVELTPLGGSDYAMHATVKTVDFSAVTNPVAVAVSLGDDHADTEVTATFS